MIILIYVALLGWIPVCLALFVALPARQAAIAGVIGAWLLLPPVSIPIALLPDYDKSMAAVVGIILATLIFQPHRLLGFRARWFDLPIVIWCLCPIASSLSNDLGLYDGLSTSLVQIVRWGLPYLIGRLYFGDQEGLRELTIGIVIGGLILRPPLHLRNQDEPRAAGPSLRDRWLGRDADGWLSPESILRDRPGARDVDDGGIADGRVALEKRLADTTRHLPRGEFDPADPGGHHGHVPINRCPAFDGKRPVYALAMHPVQLEALHVGPPPGRAPLLRGSNPELLDRRGFRGIWSGRTWAKNAPTRSSIA